MKLSPTGKPLCSQCQRLAVVLGNYHLSHGYLRSLTYCEKHAASMLVPDAIRVEVGYEIEPVLDQMLYWRLPISFEEVWKRIQMPRGTSNPNLVTADEIRDALKKINPERFVGRPGLEARRMQQLEDHFESTAELESEATQ